MSYGRHVDEMSIALRRDVERWLRGDSHDAEHMRRTRIEAAMAASVLVLLAPLHLAAVNAALWERESTIRRVAAAASSDNPASNKEIADLARALCKLNDLRRELIRKLGGDEGEEKIYT